MAKNGKRSSGGKKNLSLNGVLTGNQVSYANSMVCALVLAYGDHIIVT